MIPQTEMDETFAF